MEARVQGSGGHAARGSLFIPGMPEKGSAAVGGAFEPPLVSAGARGRGRSIVLVTWDAGGGVPSRDFGRSPQDVCTAAIVEAVCEWGPVALATTPWQRTDAGGAISASFLPTSPSTFLVFQASRTLPANCRKSGFQGGARLMLKPKSDWTMRSPSFIAMRCGAYCGGSSGTGGPWPGALGDVPAGLPSQPGRFGA